MVSRTTDWYDIQCECVNKYSNMINQLNFKFCGLCILPVQNLGEIVVYKIMFE